MIRENDIELANYADAAAIALMSKELIEYGLGWTWKQGRIIHSMRNEDRNVVVVKNGGTVEGFGIMEYGMDDAHLLLFAVRPERRRRNMGSALLRWLEETARVAGLERVTLETRLRNRGGRSFYRARGFEEVEVVRGYYNGRESAVRMVHAL